MKKRSMIRKGLDKLLSMRAFGQSKHRDKLIYNGKPARNKIYASCTLTNYIAACCRFLRWARRKHGCNDLNAAQQYVGEYLRLRIQQGMSAWTVRAEAAALAKMFQCSMCDFGVTLPKRRRRDVTQHRGNRWSGHYDSIKHKALELFCRACGLRRHEVEKLRPSDVYRSKKGNVIIHVRQGKGGKERFVISLNDIPLELAEQAATRGDKLIFPHIPKYAPVHTWRRAYANDLYQRLARLVEEIPRQEQYICRGERAGIIYDKRAMQAVSKMLGHSRLDVVTSYLG